MENKNLKPGNVNELIEASKNNISISMLRRTFEGKLIKGISLKDSSFARCSFILGSIYGSKFIDCDFVKCDFMNSDLYGVTFENCTLNNCKFDNAKMNQVSFDSECRMTECSFNALDLVDKGVSGIDVQDLRVISEEEIKSSKVLESFGFVFDDQCYKFVDDEDYNNFIGICYDKEYNIYRTSIFINSTCIYTADIFNLDEYSNIELNRMLRQILETAKLKYNNNNNIILSINNLIRKLIKLK